MNNKSMSKLVVPGAKQAIEQMKYEIASELGVKMGPDATSRANGSVGGEITKRIVQMGEQHIGWTNYQTKKIKKMTVIMTVFFLLKMKNYIKL